LIPWRINVNVPNDLPVSRARVLDEIRATMARIGLDPSDVRPQARLVDNLAIDSLDWADLTMRLEETLSIDLGDERLASMKTVQDVVDLVYAALVEARGAPA
jgi:acyl carrier protein